MFPLQPASLPVSFLSVTGRIRNAIKQCELINFTCAACCKGGENFFNLNSILFKRLMICNYKKEQITPTISANQIPAILIRLNQALLYKRAVIFCSIQPTHLIEVFSLIKYVYKSHSRWKAIIVSIATRK